MRYEEEELRFTIYYQHKDCKVKPGVEWEDHWSCACNGECPECGMRDIEPMDWVEHGDQDDRLYDEWVDRTNEENRAKA